MTPQAFTVIADMLKKRAGLVFGPEKRYLVECRLSSVLRRHGFADLDALATSLRNGDGNLSKEVTEAMTTHETSFFRDVKPFETFRHVVLPQMLQRRAASRTLRILCCAASTGQEPYSLAIILSEEQNRLRGWRWEILALDISRPVLDKAREGLYTQFEVQRGLPPLYLHKYFSKSDQHWQVNPELRSKVSFTYHNLLHTLVNYGRFDIVFCRNVLIYFDIETKTRTLQNIHRVMAEDGCLFLGGSETVINIDNSFQKLPGFCGIYSLSGMQVFCPEHARSDANPRVHQPMKSASFGQ